MHIPSARWPSARWSRMALGLAAALVMAVSIPAHAQNSAAESYIAQNTAKAISLLKDRSLSESDRRQQMQALISSLLDLKRMALFTLGPAAKTASPADIDAFVAAYQFFALANYTAELGGYSGQSLNVTGAMERAPGDYIVSAVVRDSGDKTGEPVPVSFRVLDEGGGKFALVDAAVEGVWFTLAQRDDFTGFLGQNGGDVSKLAVHLKDMAAQAGAAGRASR